MDWRLLDWSQRQYIVGNFVTFGFWRGLRSNICLMSPLLNLLINWRYRFNELAMPKGFEMAYPMTRRQRSDLGKPLWEWQKHDFYHPDMTYQELEKRFQTALNAWVALDASHELCDEKIDRLERYQAYLLEFARDGVLPFDEWLQNEPDADKS